MDWDALVFVSWGAVKCLNTVLDFQITFLMLSNILKLISQAFLCWFFFCCCFFFHFKQVSGWHSKWCYKARHFSLEVTCRNHALESLCNWKFCRGTARNSLLSPPYCGYHRCSCLKGRTIIFTFAADFLWLNLSGPTGFKH